MTTSYHSEEANFARRCGPAGPFGALESPQAALGRETPGEDGRVPARRPPRAPAMPSAGVIPRREPATL